MPKGEGRPGRNSRILSAVSVADVAMIDFIIRQVYRIRLNTSLSAMQVVSLRDRKNVFVDIAILPATAMLTVPLFGIKPCGP